MAVRTTKPADSNGCSSRAAPSPLGAAAAGAGGGVCGVAISGATAPVVAASTSCVPPGVGCSPIDAVARLGRRMPARVVVADRRARRQRRQRLRRVGRMQPGHVLGRRPGQRIERQPVADRRIAGDQVAALVAQVPGAGVPARPAGARRRRPAARSRPARRGRARTPGAAAPAPAVGQPRIERDRRCSAACARARGSTRRPRRPGRRCSRSTPSRSASRARNSPRRRRRSRRSRRARRRTAPGRSRSARRPCASRG